MTASAHARHSGSPGRGVELPELNLAPISMARRSGCVGQRSQCCNRTRKGYQSDTAVPLLAEARHASRTCWVFIAISPHR
jgi:hypothetical protein